MRSLKRLVVPDWLRERRRELGMPPDPVVHQPLGQLLLKGAVLGSLLVLTPFALLVVLENQQRSLEAEVLALVPVEARVGNAERQAMICWIPMPIGARLPRDRRGALRGGPHACEGGRREEEAARLLG